MAREHGFKFTIKGEVFVPQKSNSGADIVAAFVEANEIRTKIQAELLDVPATIEISEPVSVSRLAAEVKAVELPLDGDQSPNKASTDAEAEAISAALAPPADSDPSIYPPDEEGPTPALDLPSRRKRGKRGLANVAPE